MSQPDFSAMAPWGPSTTAADGAALDGAGVRGAIARAAAATGVDFAYLLAEARLESGLNPQAHASASSAAGLYQFTNATWERMLRRHGGQLGGGSLASPSLTSASLAGLEEGAGLGAASGMAGASAMDLRYDPETSAFMAAHLADDNRRALTATLGRDPEPSELYLAHFLGLEGATRFLQALQADPTQSAAALMPRAAGANRAIFYDAGRARSVGEVMELLRSRLTNAMNDVNRDMGGVGGAGGMGTYGQPLPWNLAAAGASAQPASSAPEFQGGPIARQFAAAQQQDFAGLLPGGAAATEPPAAPPSMAQTLEGAFGLGDSAAGNAAPVPDFVRAAYGRIRALGL